MINFFSRLFGKEFSGRELRPADQDSNKSDADLPPTKQEPKRPKIGLALSSGAAKGLAHIGVIQVLEENDIHIDAIAGASMGAYVGALWAAGHDSDELIEFAATVKNKMANLALLDPVFPPRRGFIKGRKARARLQESLGDRTIEELDKDLYIVATELDNLSRKIFETGSIVDAVHASIAIPGVCEPVTIDGIDYTDGGVADPMPVEVLKDAGMDIIIAVCVMPTAHELKHKKERNKKPTNWFNKHFNYWHEGNLFNIQRSAEFGSQMRLAELSMRDADVKIRPIVCDASWHDYSSYKKYIRVGREATESALEEIKKLTGQSELTFDQPNKLPVYH